MRKFNLAKIFIGMALVVVFSANAFASDGIRLVGPDHETSFLLVGESKANVEKTLRSMGCRWISWVGENKARITVAQHGGVNAAISLFPAVENEYGGSDLKLTFHRNFGGVLVLDSYQIVRN